MKASAIPQHGMCQSFENFCASIADMCRERVAINLSQVWEETSEKELCAGGGDLRYARGSTALHQRRPGVERLPGWRRLQVGYELHEIRRCRDATTCHPTTYKHTPHNSHNCIPMAVDDSNATGNDRVPDTKIYQKNE